MKRCFCYFMILILGINASIVRTEAADHENEIAIVSKYAIVWNMEENTVLYEKNAQEQMYPASLTKIMTTLVALEHIDNLDEEIVMEEAIFEGLAEEGASVAGYEIEERARLMDLLYGIMLPSGADAARAIAFYVAGSEEAYVEMMNQKAKELNMEHTHFVNVTGLHEDAHTSSANDLLLLLQEALKNEVFREIYCADSYTSRDGLKTFHSTLSMLNEEAQTDSSFILGAKTGYTLEAGLCLSFLTEVNDATYLVILANAGNDFSTAQHIKDAKQVYEYLEEHYAFATLYHANEVVKELPVEYGDQDQTQVFVKEDVPLLVKDGKVEIAYQMMEEKLIAPVESNDCLGTIQVSSAQISHTYSLYALHDVKRNWIAYGLHAWWFYAIVLCVLMAYRKIICKKKRKVIANAKKHKKRAN